MLMTSYDLEQTGCGNGTNPTMSNSSGLTVSDEEDQQRRLGRAESQALVRLKILVLAFFVLAAIGVSLTAYYYTTNAEHNVFATRFEAQANKVVDSIGRTMDHTLAALDALSVNLASFSRYSNSTWPFVTMPNFAVHVAKIRALSMTTVVTKLHLVTKEDRPKWEQYTASNHGWM